MHKPIHVVLFVLVLILGAGNVSAEGSSGSPSKTTGNCGQEGGTCSEDFAGGAASLAWTNLKDACLTAGNGSGSIPACARTVAGYAIPADERVEGQGALLLTPPATYRTGAILSAFAPFPLSQGIDITFTTYTFGGSGDGLAGNGADGIVFFLTSGTDATGKVIPPPSSTGGEGGSMGYDCSNGNGVYDGIAYGYLGLGIDEFGNFLNAGDNGSQGVWNSNLNPLPGQTSQGSNPGTGGNTYYNHGTGLYTGGGVQYQPERIGLRGAGNTNWAWLQNQNPNYYSGSLHAGMVQAACRSGKYYASVASHKNGTTTYGNELTPIPYNYNPLPGGSAILPDNEPIANNSKSATRHPTSLTLSGDIAWPITYRLKISADGWLSVAYRYNGGVMHPVLTNFNIASANGPLPSSLRFGFSAGTGGSDNVHEITCFKASPLTSTHSAAAHVIQSGQYRTGTQIYLASYAADNWWGSMQAIPLVLDGHGDLAASHAATWDGKCTLTGGWCDSMGTDAHGNPVHKITAAKGFVTPESRFLVTATGADTTTADVGFSMQQPLRRFPSAVQAALSAATSGDSASSGQQRLDWLLGMRCFEQLYRSTPSSNGPITYSGDCFNAPPGRQRARTYVLGDLIDANPIWVGAPVTNQYSSTFHDYLYGNAVPPPENRNGAQNYVTFAAHNATRLNVVYVGSNDGYLHGFEAGSFNADGTFNSAGNDGKEVLGYMPYGVLLNQASQLTNPLYSHQYMVDATPGVGDLFYGGGCSNGICSGGTWHTWLVGGVGSDGKEIYALDVTNPANFSAAKAASLVIGDWTNATMPHLGNTVGAPSIVRMHNGQWAIIFGNGLHSGTSAGVYMGLVDQSTGAVSFLFLDTGVGSHTLDNGIAYVTASDLDGDGIADYLYAGDLQGNVWRFDVTGKSSADWRVSHFPGSKASVCSNSGTINTVIPVTYACSPLFTATSTTTINGIRVTVPQPISTGIVTATIQTHGASRHMLYFGTGQQTPQTGNSGTLYAPASTGSSKRVQQQAFYGIWDWNMGAWNALSMTRLASATGPHIISASNLQTITSTEKRVTGQGRIAGYRTLSAATPLCWAASSTCPSGNTQYGWMYNLPDGNEQIIYSPIIIGGAVVVNTAVPPVASTTPCRANTQTGWTMAFDATSGGALSPSFFPARSGASGVQANAVGTPTTLTHKGKVYLVSQIITGGVFIPQVSPSSHNSPGRVSWREIRN